MLEDKIIILKRKNIVRLEKLYPIEAYIWTKHNITKYDHIHRKTTYMEILQTKLVYLN